MDKKGVVFLCLIALIGFASAVSHPICNPGNDPSIHGVYIDGVCYDCGEDDLVCPEEYGADCSSSADADCAVVAEAFWSANGVSAIKSLTVTLPAGTNVSLVAKGIASGVTVTFHVYENDLLVDDDIKTLTAVSSGGKAVAIWKVNETDLDKSEAGDTDEFYFTATGTGVDLDTTDRTDEYKYLNITTTFTGPVITQCSNYTTNTTCIADAESVGDNGIVTPRVDGTCYYDILGNCSWNGSVCQQTTTETARTLNPVGCGAARGSCIYDSTEEAGDCSLEDFFTISYTSTAEPLRCPAWTTGAIPCPAQIRLPFFSFFNIIAVVCIIAIIYSFSLMKKESL